MKKQWNLIAAALAVCCLGCGVTGCAPTEEEPTKLYAPYYEEDLNEMTFTDMQTSLVLDMSANTYLKTLLLQTEYYEYTPTAEETASVNYTLSLQDMDLQIFNGGVVRFLSMNGESVEETTAKVIGNGFSYFETMFLGGEVAFEGYNAEQTIQVTNALQATATVSDSEGFLDAMQDLRIIKVKDKAHYQTGEALYTVTIGQESLVFYENFASKNGELYILSQGDYEFFKELKFENASGWLPWL